VSTTNKTNNRQMIQRNMLQNSKTRLPSDKVRVCVSV
jgi:hypothetical protein